MTNQACFFIPCLIVRICDACTGAGPEAGVSPRGNLGTYYGPGFEASALCFISRDNKLSTYMCSKQAVSSTNCFMNVLVLYRY